MRESPSGTAYSESGRGRTFADWACRERRLPTGERPLIMGIVNVTPDSFSDGGRCAEPEQAVAHGTRLVEEGADILDIGGESTRPGAAPVPPDRECERVLPVIRALAARHDVPISVDTTKADVARAALEAGAAIINDVSALRADPDMARTAAESGAGVVLMHMQGSPRTMQRNPAYGDVVRDIADFLEARVRHATASGIERARLAVDPGIGFGKTVEHNLALLANLRAFVALGLPVVVGLSRKSFLGKLTGRDVDNRLAAGLAGLACSVMGGARVMRVHDVAASRDALQVVAAVQARRRGQHVELD